MNEKMANLQKMMVCEINNKCVKFKGAQKLEARKLKARNLKGREF